MPLIRLITFLGLAISLAQAIPLLDSDKNMIKQVVTLMTRPDLVIKNTPELKPFEQYATRYPGLYQHQLSRAFELALTSLRDMGDHHSPLVLESISAHHGTTDQARMALYRSSIYSRLVDLAQDNPETWQTHMQLAQQQLQLKLQESLLALQAAHLAPMGKPEEIKRIQNLAANFAKKNQEEINQYVHRLLEQIPSYDEEMKYLSKEEVNKALEQTNANNPLPATLINGLPTHPHQQGGISAPSAHPVSPAVAPHFAQPVAAAA